MRPLLAVVLLAGFATAAPVPKAIKKKQDDATQLVGTWKPTAKGSAWFRFDAEGKVKTWYDTPGSEMIWTYTADAKGAANRLRLTEIGSAGVRTYDCVFDLDGDALKFLFVTTRGKEPPEKLEAGPDFQLHEMTRDISAK